jgi:hypothetical protein
MAFASLDETASASREFVNIMLEARTHRTQGRDWAPGLPNGSFLAAKIELAGIEASR